MQIASFTQIVRASGRPGNQQLAAGFSADAANEIDTQGSSVACFRRFTVPTAPRFMRS
jgi:hypothetical protein